MFIEPPQMNWEQWEQTPPWSENVNLEGESNDKWEHRIVLTIGLVLFKAEIQLCPEGVYRYRLDQKGYEEEKKLGD